MPFRFGSIAAEIIVESSKQPIINACVHWPTTLFLKCAKDGIEPDDIVWVHACDPDREKVHYGGPRLPSSESILHHMIYEARADSRCVIHAHDPVATSTTAAGLVPESARVEPYGTVALARIAIETCRGDRRIILLRNHGYVATGESFDAVVNTIVELHLRLLECPR